MKRGTNLPALAVYNQALVLDLIRRAPDGISRIELAEQTGLSAQTLSNVARRLLHDGLVREAGKAVSGPGKPRTILQLETDARYAVGVHLDPTVTTMVVLDLEGRPIAHVRSRTPRRFRPEETIAKIAASVLAIIETSGVPRERIIGVGIASPGPLDARQREIFDPPLLEGWHNVPIGEALEQATGYPVHVEKDVTAAMIAETWISTRDVISNGILFYYGTGVGIGIVVNGEIVRGASSNSGDIGHLIVDPDGPLCRCGKRGCLGCSISPQSMVAEAFHRGIFAEPSDLSDPVVVESAFTHLLARANSGQAEALDVVQIAARRLGRGLLGMAGMLDVDQIVFGGPFWERIADIFLPIIAESLETDPASMLTHGVTLRSSRLGEDIAAIGAACVILDRALTPSTTDLLIER